MPQYELDADDGATRQVRGRSPEDAVRRALGPAPGAEVSVGEAELGTGWCEVRVGGAPAGRVRPRARMTFRRD